MGWFFLYYCHFFVGYLFIEYNVTLEKVCFFLKHFLSLYFLNVQKTTLLFSVFYGIGWWVEIGKKEFGEHFLFSFFCCEYFNLFLCNKGIWPLWMVAYLLSMNWMLHLINIHVGKHFPGYIELSVLWYWSADSSNHSFKIIVSDFYVGATLKSVILHENSRLFKAFRDVM